jgi:hypothetical protein
MRLLTMPLFFFCGKPTLMLILNRDAPDIRPDNPALSDIRYPAGYQIGQPDIR